MVDWLARFLFACCEESQTHSFAALALVRLPILHSS